MCDKQPYNTYQSAIAALKGLIKRGLRKLKAYKCTECSSYHLASFSDNRKPKGYLGRNKIHPNGKKVKKSTFKKIKVTKEEIEKGRQHQIPKAGLFYKLKNELK